MWYRFNGRYGPGHQSTSVRYRWYKNELSDAQLKDAWEDVFDDKIYSTQICGEAEAIDELPEDVKKQKIQRARWQIEAAERMLEILGES